MKINFLIRHFKVRKAFMMLPLIGMFSLTGCEELIDCIASATPELQGKQLFEGTKGIPYSETISAEVRNDPNDDGYKYFFNVYGDLPDGLNYSVNRRIFTIKGTPIKQGTFTFKVVLRVDPPENYNDDGSSDDGNRICFGDDTTERTYSIKVI